MAAIRSINEKLPIIEIVLYYSVIIASPVIYIAHILVLGAFAFLKD